jgi:hypothetical protein
MADQNSWLARPSSLEPQTFLQLLELFLIQKSFFNKIQNCELANLITERADIYSLVLCIVGAATWNVTRHYNYQKTVKQDK